MRTAAAALPLVTVPRLWPEATVVVAATGPSLDAADLTWCRNRPGVHLLAVKDAIRLAPWADVLYACDRKWWRAHPETAAFSGLKYGLEALPERSDVQILRNTGEIGLELDPTGVKVGRNSGYQAVNVAVHLGARHVVLLGFDMQADAHGKVRWFGNHPYGGPTPPFITFRERFETMVEPLREAGITVTNCTPHSALEHFPLRPLREVLP